MQSNALLPRMWRSATNNLGLKVASVVAAVAAFYLVQGEEDAQRAVFVDVVALMPAPDASMMLVSGIPDQVKVTLRGSRSRINALSREDFDPVQVNLSDTSRRYYYFDPSAIEVPLGVSIVQVEPSAVPLSWAEVSQRQVPIRVHVTGQAAEGLQVKQPVTTVPARVTIHGPTMEVNAIQEVETDSVMLDGLGVGEHIRRIPLQHPAGHVSYLDEFEVQVRLDVTPEIAERSLPRLEVATVGEGDFAVRPGAVDVVLRGPRKALGNVAPEHVVPFVDLDALDAGGGTNSLPVKVRGLPATVTVLRVTPEEVLVRRKR